MGTAYALLIQEDVAQLHAAEKAARDRSRTDRVRLLRFVKEGRVPGIAQAAAALGYSAHRRALVAALLRGRSGGLSGAAAAARHGGTHHAGSVGELAGGDAGWPHRRVA